MAQHKKNKQHNKSHSKAHDSHQDSHDRPHNEHHDEVTPSSSEEVQSEFSKHSNSENQNHEEPTLDPKKEIKIDFPYSQMVRDKIPKTFELAEKVATDWVNNGEFKDLPIEQPLAQYFVGEGLRRAKDVEKKVTDKLNETGVLPIVKSQLEVLKNKLVRK